MEGPLRVCYPFCGGVDADERVVAGITCTVLIRICTLCLEMFSDSFGRSSLFSVIFSVLVQLTRVIDGGSS